MSSPARTRTPRAVALTAAALLATALPAVPAAAAAHSFASTTPGPWVDAAAAPVSTIEVAGAPSVIRDVDVTIRITHDFLADADILLVGPQGQSVVLLSDAGCDAQVYELDLTFDQSAAGPVPTVGPITSGTYLPTNVDGGCDGGTEEFPGAPFPTGPWSDTLDVFNGTDPIGTWSLFYVDDLGTFPGRVSSWSLTIDADPTSAPQVTSPATASGTVGDTFSHTFTAPAFTGATLTFSDADLPPGVTRTGDTISGTPTTPGEYSVTVTASNGIDPDATQELVISIDERPTITSAATGQAFEGVPFTHTFTASGFPAPTLSFPDVSLPAGLSLDGDTISGRATEAGDFAVTVTASNGVAPDAVQTFELKVAGRAPAPAFPLAEGQPELTNGDTVTFTLTFEEPVTGLTADDFAIEGSVGGGVVSLTGSGRDWTLTVTDIVGDGWLMLVLDEGSWTDAEGRWGPGAHSPWVAVDRTAPELTGPAEPVTITTEPGKPGATVAYDVTAADAEIPSVTPGFAAASAAAPSAGPAAVDAQSCIPASGSFFAIGTTTVECSASDEAGNVGQLAFDVTVVDDEAPEIAPVDDVRVELAEGETSAPVDFEPPSASDNSGEVEVTCDLEPGARLAEGGRTVTCTAADPSGNEASSAFTVAVVAPASDDDGSEDDGSDDDGSEDDGSDDAPEDDAPSDEGPELPRTGSDVAPLALAALMLLAAGSGLFVATQRRRSAG